ncbi:elongation factor G [Hippea maritima]|uniref:Elongation factor G n=1 Tax=Hippea maritima (strain ATCC 700847 / DSM 10411 / MH2) TaxID=760142 RepID=F2LWG4_HIPMA|nr:elongation factor G [Hippea maritima]AEA34073.1 small GTP-binding protein [Hippea maritima DSM 10411]
MGVATDKKRVVAICGSGGVGKTTLCEDILFKTKKITRKGSTDKGNTTMDFDSEEIDRKISLQLAVGYTEWKKHFIYLIDTPGYHNFIADALCGIKASDAAVMLIDIKDGPEAQNERLLDEIRKENKPAIFFLNGIDKEDINFQNTIQSIKDSLTPKAFLLQLPILKDAKVVGYVDIIQKKAFSFEDNKEMELPAEIADELEERYMELVEEVSTYDDELMEKYLEGEELDKDTVVKTLKEAVKSGGFYPVILGSGLKGYGTEQLLDEIVDLLPSPENMFEEPAGLVFKTYNDPQMGKISLVRVYSGSLKADTSYYNVNKDQEERLGTINLMLGKSLSKVEEATTGDIFAVAKLKITQTGDTIANKGSEVKCEFVKMPLPYISAAIYGASKGDEEKIGAAISKIIEADPSLSFTRNDETGEFILTGMGKLHLETVVSRLKKKYGVEAQLKTPKVAYKETIKGKTSSHGRYKKQTGGHGQFGDCVIEIEPLPRGKGFEFEDLIVGGAIPKQFIPSVEKGIKNAMEQGFLAGYPMIDIKIKLVDGKYHPVDSSDLAFQMAGSIAFKEGVAKCKPVLLEPIVEMEVYVPDEVMGDVIGDLNSRRGRVLGMEPYEDKKGYQRIRALVPEAEILEYAPSLRSLTAGRGFFKYQFSTYEEVPPQIAEKIIEESKQEEDKK